MATMGHCFCKQTSWEYSGQVNWACYCHCDDCRRNCSSPLVGWLGVPLKNFKWTGKKPKSFESSKGVYRHFCEDCGSPIGFEADHYEGDMQLYAGSLAQPNDFKPEFHVNYESKLPWLSLEDDLPKHEGTLLQSSNKIKENK